MPGDVIIRPLRMDDVDAADAVGWAALKPMIAAEHLPDEDVRRRRGRARIARFARTDPAGAWVAELDGRVVGLALALVRESVWGLSLFAVAPEHHGRGIGARLLEAALRYGEGCRGGIILSSTDPRAMHRYARAGFRLLPAVAAAGAVNRLRIPGGLRARPSDGDRDLGTVEIASRHVRGASHAPDVEGLRDLGCELLVLPGRGFAMHRDGSPAVLAALDDDAGADLLWSCFAAAAPGASVHVDFITAGNDWAVAAALDAGLALSPDGPVFVRGTLGTLAPFLPSGAYL